MTAAGRDDINLEAFWNSAVKVSSRQRCARPLVDDEWIDLKYYPSEGKLQPDDGVL